MIKTVFKAVTVPLLYMIWLCSASAVGVEIQFSDGSALKLRGWWIN